MLLLSMDKAILVSNGSKHAILLICEVTNSQTCRHGETLNFEKAKRQIYKFSTHQSHWNNVKENKASSKLKKRKENGVQQNTRKILFTTRVYRTILHNTVQVLIFIDSSRVYIYICIYALRQKGV